jgi:hypothetical protein
MSRFSKFGVHKMVLDENNFEEMGLDSGKEPVS